jgi:phosphotransferase system HPr (HPr) family protein
MSDSPTVRRAVVIPDKDPNGLHMRPAHALVELAKRYQSKIEIVRETIRVDAKSIFDVLTIGGEPGVEIVLEAWGDDAETAVDALTRFIESGFETTDTTCQNPAQ